jgi:hypothetical protein
MAYNGTGQNEYVIPGSRADAARNAEQAKLLAKIDTSTTETSTSVKNINKTMNGEVVQSEQIVENTGESVQNEKAMIEGLNRVAEIMKGLGMDQTAEVLKGGVDTIKTGLGGAIQADVAKKLSAYGITPASDPAMEAQIRSMVQGFIPGNLTSFDSGGMLPPGLTMAYNGTGLPERVVPAGGGGVGTMVKTEIHFNGNVYGDQHLKSEIHRLVDQRDRQFNSRQRKR